MRKYLLAAAAAAAITSPAMARDGTGYVGVDVGALLVEDIKIDLRTAAGQNLDDYAVGDHNFGYDVAANAGYDFGAFRAEAEVAFKRASHDEYNVAPTLFNSVDGKSTSLSVMGNLLLDFGPDDGWQGFVGGGLGFARTRVNLATTGLERRLSDSGFAYQVLAGIRTPVSDNIDFGVKYRFYNHDLDDTLDFRPVLTGFGEADARFRSHSLLASLVFNFGAPPPPPPPPPPAPERG
jgi:opacity protein-like surface antigen